MKKLLSAAALAAFAISGHATVEIETFGSTTTLTENFDQGTSFALGDSAAIWTGTGGNKYLYVAHHHEDPNATLNFSSTPTFAQVAVSFWYSVTNSADTQYSYFLFDDKPKSELKCEINQPCPSSSTDPGLHQPTVSKLATFTFDNIASGNHTLKFFNGWVSPNTWGHHLRIDDLKIVINPVPEPETYAMLLAGLGVMGAVARRRKAQQA